ncbi:MAG: CvpA family protein [Spirochaetaceae bacterium]|nr:MAG: CvpA family protein [Spirochaetaceae bacterium]
MQLNILDIIFSLILAFMVIRAGFRGFVQEFMAVASILFGIVAAVWGTAPVASRLDLLLGESIWNNIIAFLGLFLLVYLITKLIERVLNDLVERIHLDSLDHALGLFFGAIEGLLLVSLLILLMQVQPLFSVDQLLADSLYADLLMPLAPYAGTLFGNA